MMKGTDMNIHEAQMYVNLCSSALAHGFLKDHQDSRVADLQKIAIERHCGNGYFSFDGILDDLADLTGSEDLASDILNNAA
jgi:hypothetical protein